MKTRTLIFSAAIAAAIAIVAAYQLGVHRGAPASASEAAAKPATVTDPKTGRPVLYWHDPMTPGPRFDKPGKSPFMDMELVPVFADEAGAGSGGATVSAQVAQNLGLRTGLVRKGVLSAGVDASGIVTQNERATEVVQSRVTAYTEALHVRALLDPVSKGQALATLYAPEWTGALEEYLGLRRAQAASTLIDASRARLRLLSIPDDVVTRSEQTGAAQTRFTLNAPIAGVVAELGVRDGAMVLPGMTLFRITDLSTVWVIADVPQTIAAQVRPGVEAEVRLPGMEDRPFLGRVLAVLPDVDVTTRTLKARVEIRNPALTLKPGMFVRVLLKERSAQPVLLVPQEAVIATGKRTVVIVATDDGRYTPVDVQLGREGGGDVEVRSGLMEGQRVVLSGQFLLDSEASFKSGLGRLSTDAAMPAASGAKP